MAEKYIWIDVKGGKKAIAGIDLYHATVQVRAKRFLDELADEGTILLANNVPTYTDYSSGYTLEHVGRSEAQWEAGSGDSHATVGIRAGHSYHPVYVNCGTGIYGPFKRPYTTKPPGGLMWFDGSIAGKRIGVPSVLGQRPQRFLYTTFRDLQVYALARLTMKRL